jgi:hypothetical protein
MNLTDKEEFNAIVQLTAAIISRPDLVQGALPELRREAVVNEAYAFLHRIATRVTEAQRGQS